MLHFERRSNSEEGSGRRVPGKGPQAATRARWLPVLEVTISYWGRAVGKRGDRAIRGNRGGRVWGGVYVLRIGTGGKARILYGRCYL